MTMRWERWWWLAAFCVISLGIHLFGYWRSPSLALGGRWQQAANEIEVALEPLPEEEEKKAARPAPKPEAPATPRPEPKEREAPEPASPEPLPSIAPATQTRREALLRTVPLSAPVTPVRPMPAAPQPADVKPEPEETPLLPAQPLRKVPAPERFTTGPLESEPAPEMAATPAPQTPEEQPDVSRAAGKLAMAPRVTERPGLSLENTNKNPLAGTENEPPTPAAPAAARGPRIARTTPGDTSLAGGGSPAPSTLPGGTGGAPAPEAPPEDVVFRNGGAGGEKLPRIAPRPGGGGGQSVLTAENPLARVAVPEERPGQGPGTGGGAGMGAGGGTGGARGRGIGTDPNARVALGTLRARSGPGIGAGSGDGIGTRSPGGGRGTGAELPGTGGTGFGTGRGKGSGIGAGMRPGRERVARGGGGDGSTAGGGDGGGGGTRFASLSRGLPFPELLGMQRGGRGGTTGGPAAGGGSGGRSGGLEDRIHIVYVLDASGSMRQGDKIGKAREALKKALGELKPWDTFNIITFYSRVHAFSTSMVPATPGDIRQAQEYVDSVEIAYGTNISAGFEQAFAVNERITHMLFLSDGEPTTGIEDYDELREMIRARNRRKRARISTLALGLGEDFPGISLLKGIAQDNGGDFAYINLAR